jgi:hypothetical protein
LPPFLSAQSDVRVHPHGAGGGLLRLFGLQHQHCDCSVS